MAEPDSGAPVEGGAHIQPELRERLQGSPTMRLVGLAGQAIGHRYRRVLAEEDGLSPGAAGVLSALAWGEGRALEAGTPGRATHSELAQRCMITPATLTGVVSTLEKAGYVRRERDRADRRVVWLVLTEAGRERAGQLGAKARAANEELVKQLTPELEAALRGFLITVIESDLAVVHQEAPPVPEPDQTKRAVHPDTAAADDQTFRAGGSTC